MDGHWRYTLYFLLTWFSWSRCQPPIYVPKQRIHDWSGEGTPSVRRHRKRSKIRENESGYCLTTICHGFTGPAGKFWSVKSFWTLRTPTDGVKWLYSGGLWAGGGRKCFAGPRGDRFQCGVILMYPSTTQCKALLITAKCRTPEQPEFPFH